MRGVCDFTDFFVIATGRNARQTKAIYDEVAGVLKKEHELLPRSSAGATEATWIVADYLDVVLHLFTPETRELLPARGAVERRPVGRARSRDRLALVACCPNIGELGLGLGSTAHARGERASRLTNLTLLARGWGSVATSLD